MLRRLLVRALIVLGTIVVALAGASLANAADPIEGTWVSVRLVPSSERAILPTGDGRFVGITTKNFLPNPSPSDPLFPLAECKRQVELALPPGTSAAAYLASLDPAKLDPAQTPPEPGPLVMRAVVRTGDSYTGLLQGESLNPCRAKESEATWRLLPTNRNVLEDCVPSSCVLFHRKGSETLVRTKFLINRQGKLKRRQDGVRFARSDAELRKAGKLLAAEAKKATKALKRETKGAAWKQRATSDEKKARRLGLGAFVSWAKAARSVQKAFTVPRARARQLAQCHKLFNASANNQIERALDLLADRGVRTKAPSAKKLKNCQKLV